MMRIDTPKKLARVAGLLFLTVVVCGVFAEFFVRQKIFVPGDSVATANNIMASTGLFRLGIVSDLIMSTTFLFYTWLMYLLLKPVNKNQAQIMLLCVAISVVIMCVNMLNQVASLLLLSDAAYLNVFEKSQLQSLATFFIRLHTNGYVIAQIFFGLYLFPLGYLIYNSGFLPRVVGVFLMMGCFGDLIGFFKFFLFPDVGSVILDHITIPADIGEFSLCIYLIVVGVKSQSAIVTSKG